MNQRMHLLISGRVQGVFFRATAHKTATQLGVRGFVRNLPDGRVEVVAEGEPQALQKLSDWCRHGPRGAIVEQFSTAISESLDEFDCFEVK